MYTSPQMQKRLDKIERLCESGYQVKKTFGGICCKLISPEGKDVVTNIFDFKEKNLPGFSPIAALWSPFIAVQIRHWKFFWLIGIVSFVYELIISIPTFELVSDSIPGLIIGIIYGVIYPYQKWLFSKSNKKQISVWKSIFIGIVLLLIAATPATLIAEIANPTL